MTLSLILLTLASLVGLVAWIWLIVVAFKNDEKTWGILLIVSLVIPFVGLVILPAFLIMQWRIARQPAIVLLSSLVLSILGAVMLARDARRTFEEMAIAQREFIASNPQIEPNEPTPLEPLPPPPPERPRRPRPSSPDSDASPALARPTAPRQVPPSPIGSPAIVPPASDPETTPPAAVPVQPPEFDPRFSPVTVEVLRVGEPGEVGMRQIEVRAANASAKPVHELKLGLAYIDRRGSRLGRRTTVHTADGVLIAPRSTNAFTLQAFFVPQFTHEVRIEVEAVEFADGTRWPGAGFPRDIPAPRP